MSAHEAGKWEWHNGPIGRQIKIAHITLRKQLEALTRQRGLTATQWSALGILLYFPGATHSDLETILRIEKPSVTSLIQGMENKGWVVRRAHPEDARSRLLFLTDSGKALAEETRHYAELVERNALKDFTEEEAVLLRRLLEKLIRSFD